MSLKAELTTWSKAISSYEAGGYEEAISEFSKISDTSKICWNMGIVLATLGKHREAVEEFGRAVELDCYFAIGYQQKGVSNFMLGNYQDALKDFEDALLYLRGNQTINYEQLGLDFRLYSCEVLFNCGLSKIYLGLMDSGISDLRDAQSQKMIKEHDVIDDAIRDGGSDYNVFSVPVGVLFKPSQKKLKNLASRDYMGKAILVAATDVNDAYTTFTGITRLRRGQTPFGASLDASHPSLGRSASVSAIPQDIGTTPMTRSNTVGISPNSFSRSADPSSNRHSRSNTMGNELPSAAPVLNRSITSATRPAVKITTEFTQREKQPLSAPERQLSNGFDTNLVMLPKSSTAGPGEPPLRLGGGESPFLQTPQLNPRSTIKSSAVTELYDEYYQSIQESPEEDGIVIPDNLPPIGGAKKIEAWSNKTPLGASPSIALSRKGSATASTTIEQNTMNDQKRLQPQNQLPPISFGSRSPSGGGGGIPLTRTLSAATSNRESNYEVGSENGSFYDMVKIRVKVNYGTHKRGMSILPSHTYEIFINLLKGKFPELADQPLDVKFKDEDGDILSMRDEGDFEAAVDVARILGEGNGRGEGRLEIWVN
ncbi:hypothetical protein I203_103919 [Kwoniella mangroviensis CBS 8507]|uniref:uncharacterized protein n=1 Tax=Kwoniella mangroviensis CBS 8507 TaxID=1296122 RepID=UPI00080CC5CB|nr:uncharacterized protein I203_06226 [Kwoniella mangroviensis CBS 8507]OCF64495.1 hypothetical protein I203_06226 [Kwoniella mangroviensis CBS 8507]